jgi:hypothetical protein
MDKIQPSERIWNYFKGEIYIETIMSAIADKIAGYHISYSAMELLKDLGYLTKNERINKKGLLILAHQLHEKFHRNRDGVEIINPFEIKGRV